MPPKKSSRKSAVGGGGSGKGARGRGAGGAASSSNTTTGSSGNSRASTADATTTTTSFDNHPLLHAASPYPEQTPHPPSTQTQSNKGVASASSSAPGTVKTPNVSTGNKSRSLHDASSSYDDDDYHPYSASPATNDFFTAAIGQSTTAVNDNPVSANKGKHVKSKSVPFPPQHSVSFGAHAVANAAPRFSRLSSNADISSSREYSSFENLSIQPPRPPTHRRAQSTFSRKGSSSRLLGSRRQSGKKVKMDDDLRDGEEQYERVNKGWLSHEMRIFTAFWLFGCLACMQFVVVVTAANDLVGSSAPPGLILFAYTLPSVLIRAFVPYIRFPTIRMHTIKRLWNRGYTPLEKSSSNPNSGGDDKDVNYPLRLTVCAISSFTGLQLLSFSPHLGLRVLGISLTSLSSNLGDMSFYQLATRFPISIKSSFGGYAAGSGAAGLIGSAVYTLLTGWGGVPTKFVLAGMGLVPALMLLTYAFLLPEMEVVSSSRDGAAEEGLGSRSRKTKIKDFKLGDKLRLVKPLLIGYMLPLATLMFLENTATQGILPTTLFHLPLEFPSWVSGAFTHTRDFFPVYITTYQFAVFFGRTSITFFQIPTLADPWSSAPYWGLCVLEGVIWLVQLGESMSMAASGAVDATIWFGPGMVMFLVAVLGLCGGVGMSNTYWRVSNDPLPQVVWGVLDDVRATTDGIRAEEEGESSGEDTHGRHSDRDALLRQQQQTRPGLAKNRTSYLLRARTPGGTAVGGSEFPFPSGGESNTSPHTEYGALQRSQSWRQPQPQQQRDREDETALREFLVSTIALPDTFAIMAASVVSLWLQPKLCGNQVANGRGLCVGGPGGGAQ